MTLKALFIDGAKIEANANRYTFVWRGSINHNLAKLIKDIDELYGEYNDIITSNGCDLKYELSKKQMFVIEALCGVSVKILSEN